MPLKEDLKALIIKEGMSMTQVCDEISRRNGKVESLQNFSAKLTRGSLRYDEVIQVLDILGYDAQWVKRNYKDK